VRPRFLDHKCCTASDTPTATMSDLRTSGPKFTRPACRAAVAAIDRYLLPRQTSAANLLRLSIAVTDRRTDTRPFYNAYRIICGPHNNLTD